MMEAIGFAAGWAAGAAGLAAALAAGLALIDISPNSSVMGDTGEGSGTGDMLNISSSASNSSSVSCFFTGFLAGDFLAGTLPPPPPHNRTCRPLPIFSARI